MLAKGIALRAGRSPGRPLDIIIAENIRDAPTTSGKSSGSIWRQIFRFVDYVGLVETSIGKMVPIMRAEDLAADPLLSFRRGV